MKVGEQEEPLQESDISWRQDSCLGVSSVLEGRTVSVLPDLWPLCDFRS